MRQFSVRKLLLCCAAASIVIRLGFKLDVVTTRQGAEIVRTARIKLAIVASPERTLVMYTFASSDPEYRANFDYFLKFGMGGENINYFFILQQSSANDLADLPSLPKNAKFVRHRNECYDFGTFGWAISNRKVDVRSYKYVIFVNSSVRGPFLPLYWPAAMHWTSIYTERLGSKVKLVGSTINCQPVWWRSDPSQEMRQNPHVQSYVMATDQVGLKVLMDEGRVFECYESLLDTVWHSEVGASKAILDAGFSIDSLMLKYQGVDWSNRAAWRCNDWQNPYADFAYDGVMINPMEVLFVKVKSYQLESDWITSKLAATYDRWRRSEGNDTEANHGTFDKARFSYFLSKGITMSMRGRECFDVEYYIASNPDMPQETCTWNHFIETGQFEGRPFRFTCENEFSYPARDVLKKATLVARKSITQIYATSRGKESKQMGV